MHKKSIGIIGIKDYWYDSHKKTFGMIYIKRLLV